tara:strand:- start:1820 stop:1924 length:105 start_codon:yes stop_codon:yes gene_type:complete
MEAKECWIILLYDTTKRIQANQENRVAEINMILF